MFAAGNQYRPLGRAPAEHRLGLFIPGENALAVCRQQEFWCELSAHRQQSVGLHQGLIWRREAWALGVDQGLANGHPQPWSSRNFFASRAAMQPDPAE